MSGILRVGTIQSSDANGDLNFDFSGAVQGPSLDRIGASVLVANGVLSANVSTLDFTDLDFSKYLCYKFFLQRFLPATDSVSLRARVSSDNGISFDSGASDYSTAKLTVRTTTTDTSVGGDDAEAYIELAGSIGNSSTNYEGVSMEATLMHRPGREIDLIAHCVTKDIVPSPRSNLSIGRRSSGNTYDAIRFYYSSGDIRDNASWAVHAFKY
jgi:hypothetical protein